jgi:hypothetical protein
MSSTLKRGDLVTYRGHVYYYQPNGRSSYLYDRKADLGMISYAVYAPGNKQLRLASPEDIKDFLAHPRPVPPNRPPDPSCLVKIVVLDYSTTRVTIPVEGEY